MAQSNHATSKFAVEHPEAFSDWYQNSQYIACLSIKDEESLLQLADKLRDRDVRVSVFYEPDLKNQATSIAVEPSDIARRLTSHLPKSFNESRKEPIVFHYNKAHNQDQSIPPWVVKHKGESHYVHHLESNVGFSTKETPDNSHTKGSLKFKGKLEIVEEDEKTIALIT